MKQLFIESIKVKNGEFFNLSYHQARMNWTLSHFGLKKINLQEFLEKSKKPDSNFLFKCRIIYDKKIESIEYSPYSFLKKERVGIIHADEIEYKFKYENRDRLNNLIKNTGFDDIIIIKNGFVTDALFSNLVFEKDKKLYTPSTPLLSGTKRQFLLDSGRIKEKQISFTDIFSYKKVHFINALIDLDDNVEIAIEHLIF